MDIELLSLSFASVCLGWVLGRWVFSGKDIIKRTNQAAGWPESYYAKGLNYLLTDDSEKAIQAFTELVQIDQDTIEIHITLGNLFRSKGKVDQAIKTHQSLLARPNLTRSQRHLVIAELADDYLKAGLHDRAEKLYWEMTRFKAESTIAYQRLLDLYTAEKSWHQACKCAQVLYGQGEPDTATLLSQCHCEIAQSAFDNGNKKQAGIHLTKALKIDRHCVRAGLLLIELHLSTANYRLAERQLHRLIDHSPEHIILYIKPAKSIYLHNHKPQHYQKFLQRQYDINPSNRLAVALLEHYVSNRQIDKAREFLEKVLRRLPSFDAFDFALRFLKSEPEQFFNIEESLSDFLKSMQRKKNEYICCNCGYGSHRIQWHCPSCNRWSTMRAV